MAILSTTGTLLEKRQFGLLLALAIIDAPVICVMVLHLFHNEQNDLPHTSNLHVPGSNLNGAAQAMKASTFAISASRWEKSHNNYFTTATTVTRTLTTATTDDRAPLVTRYAGTKDVLLILPEDLAVRVQQMISDSAYPTCGGLTNVKHQTFQGGEEFCGFAGVAGEAQPGLQFKTFQLMRNPLDIRVGFQRADLVQVLAAAMQMMRDMVDPPEGVRNRALLAVPFILALVIDWVEKKQPAGTVNTISRAWLNSVTNSPTATTTSTTSSSSSSSSKKPCRTDVFEIQNSVSILFFAPFASNTYDIKPDCADGDCNGLNVDKKCTAVSDICDSTEMDHLTYRAIAFRTGRRKIACAGSGFRSPEHLKSGMRRFLKV